MIDELQVFPSLSVVSLSSIWAQLKSMFISEAGLAGMLIIQPLQIYTQTHHLSAC